MKALTKEEMKEIGGARTEVTCLPGSSCRDGECWHKMVVLGLEFWVSDGSPC